jgi:hypothetical protein
MEFTSIKFAALTIGLVIAWIVKKKYPDFPRDRKQVAILTIGLVLASIAVFMLFIS